MRKLSEILSDIEALSLEYERISNLEETENTEDILMDLGLAIDCLDACLMYGDYINDTNEDFDYWSY